MARGTTRLLAKVGLAIAGVALVAACTETATTAVRPTVAGAAPRALKVPISAASAEQVSAGQSTACAVMRGRNLTCWGNNAAGQASPPGDSAFTQVSVGTAHACALRLDGSIACWGANGGGQASPPSGTGFRSVSAGTNYTCAVRGDGTLTCWGDDPASRTGRTNPPVGAGFAQVSAGNTHACALRADGSVACWGGFDFNGGATSPTGTSFTQVSAADHYTCAVVSDGSLQCWGLSGNSMPVPPYHGFTQVSAGAVHTCAVRSDGSAACFGDNTSGELNIPTGVTLTQVSAGSYYSCGVTSGGPIVCWGDDSYGRATPPPVTTHVLPAATFGAPASADPGQPFVLALAAAHVPYHPEATQFTYAFDCGDGQGYRPASPNATVSCTAPAPGSVAVRGTVIDQDGDTASYGAGVTIRAPQQVVFTIANATTAHVGDTFFYSARANSVDPVISVLTPATCAVVPQSDAYFLPSNAYVRFTGVGTCTIAADAAVTPAYAAARATQSVAVLGQPQAITFTSTPPSLARVGGTYAVVATGGASGNPVTVSSLTPATCTVAVSTVRFVATGACTVAADQAGTGAYAAAPRATQTVTIASLPQTITFTSTPPSPARVGGTYTVGASVSSYFAPTYASLTPAICTAATAYLGAPSATVTFTAAGTCIVAADVSATAVYAAAPEVTQTIPVLAAVASFPATPVLDAFARADGALGANWGGFAAPLFFRVSQQHGAVGLGGGIGWAPTAFGTTQEAFVTLTALGGNGGSGAQGLVLKGQDPTNHAFGALTVTYAPQRGTVTVAALHAPPAAGTAYPALAMRFAAGDQLGARVTAAGAVTVYRNGVLVGTVTLSAADQAYFASRGGYIGLVDVAAPGALFDDFGGGSVTP